MQFHQYDFRWQNEQQTEIQAVFKNKLGRKSLRIGDSLSLEVCSDPFCAGHRVGGVWHPCPDNASGKSKCDTCKAREQKESYVFTIFDGFNTQDLDPKELDLLAEPHVVYLALFSADLIKVGVSKKERQQLRQVEQGSYATLFIAETPNGIDARQIETTLRKNGLQDKVLGSQKKNIFNPDISPQEAEKQLRKTFALHKEPLEQAPTLRSFLSENPLFVCWEDSYNLSAVDKNPKPIHPVSLEKGEWVCGTILAFKGPFLILETPDELISIHMKSLNGLQIEFDDKTPGICLNSALQNSLF